MTIDTLTRTIRKEYHLRRESRDWILPDKIQNQEIKVRAPNRNSIGFSLDNRQSPPLAFLGNNPPEHIAKMCDAIIVHLVNDTLYFFIIEQKTGSKEDCNRQLANGKFFCEWLVTLYQHHGYWPAEKVKYIGLLVWKPRPSPRKKRTSHQKLLPEKHPMFSIYYSIPNRTSFSLQDLMPRR